MAVLVRSRDNVVSISTADSLKMFALSVVWGSWIVVKNAAARAFSPLWPNGGGGGGSHGYDGDDNMDEKGSIYVDDDAVTTDAATASDKAIRRAVPRDRPPPCLSTTVYGTHSYVKVKVTYTLLK